MAMEMDFEHTGWKGRANGQKASGVSELVIAWFPPSGGKPSTKKSGTNELYERRILYGRIRCGKKGLREFARLKRATFKYTR